MIEYFVIAIIVVILMSIVFAVILNKNKLLNFFTVFAITLSSVVISVAMPFILGSFLTVSNDGKNVLFGFNIIWAIVIALVIYVTAVLLSAVLISAFVSDSKGKEIEDKVKNIVGNTKRKNKQKLQNGEELYETFIGEVPQNADASGLEKNIEQIPDNNLKEPQNPDKNIFEKSVDRGQNIDKMGVETIDKIGEIVVEETLKNNINELYQVESSFDENGNYIINLDELELNDVFGLNVNGNNNEYINVEENADTIMENAKEESLTIEEYINRAFELKEKGDFEEAILNYMYALDKGPDKDLVFWIILDICVLYKGLGQSELATGILEGYISNYGEVMDETVKFEIKRNLS